MLKHFRKTRREPETVQPDWRSGHPLVHGFSSGSSPVPSTPKTPYIGSRPLPTSPLTQQTIVFPSPSPDSTLSGSSYDSDIRAPQPRYPMHFPAAPPTTAPFMMPPPVSRARTRDPIRRPASTSEPPRRSAHTPHVSVTSRDASTPHPSTLQPRTRERLASVSSQRTLHSTGAPASQVAASLPRSIPFPAPPPVPRPRPATPVFQHPTRPGERPKPTSILKTTKQPLPCDVPLHRYLIPYQPEIYGKDQKLIYWDVSMFPDNARDYHAEVALGRKALATKYASSLATEFTRMVIEVPRIKDCYIEVKNEKGITCRDVLKAIWLKFRAKLTDEEKGYYLKELKKQYETRLEMLNGVTVFMGVVPSRSSSTSWEIILGRDPDEGMNKVFAT